MRSNSQALQVITEAKIRKRHAWISSISQDGEQADSTLACCVLTSRHAESSQGCQMSPASVYTWCYVERVAHDWFQRLISCFLLHWVHLHPYKWGPVGRNSLLPQTLGIHHSIAGKINSGLTQCSSSSRKPRFEKDIFHIPSIAPPTKESHSYMKKHWGALTIKP